MSWETKFFQFSEAMVVSSATVVLSSSLVPSDCCQNMGGRKDPVHANASEDCCNRAPLAHWCMPRLTRWVLTLQICLRAQWIAPRWLQTNWQQCSASCNMLFGHGSGASYHVRQANMQSSDCACWDGKGRTKWPIAASATEWKNILNVSLGLGRSRPDTYDCLAYQEKLMYECVGHWFHYASWRAQNVNFQINNAKICILNIYK